MLHRKGEIRGDLFKGMRAGECNKTMSFEEQLQEDGRLYRKKGLGEICSLKV